MVSCTEEEDARQAVVEQLADVAERCEQHAMCLQSPNEGLVDQLPMACPTRQVSREVAQEALAHMGDDEARYCLEDLQAMDACALQLDCNGYGVLRGFDDHCGDSEDQPCCETPEGEEQPCPAFGRCLVEVARYLASCAWDADHAVANAYNDALVARR